MTPQAASPRRRERGRLRLALGWGALWGVGAGFPLLSPRIVRNHHICPLGFSQWAVLDLSLLAAFASLGAMLLLFACLALVTWETLRRRPLADPAWAYALAAPALLGPAYFGDAALIEWLNFGGVSGIGRHRGALAAVLLVEVVAAAAFAWLYAKLLNRPTRPSPSLLAAALLAAAGATAALLPRLVPCEASREQSPPPRLIALAGRDAPTPPLLFVGIDSGNWRTLRPLLERGSLPTFERLIATGIHGEVRALWPPYWSGPAWAAIVTGVPREENGIHEDLVAVAPGLPTFEVPLTLTLELDPILAFEYALLRAGLISLEPHPRSSLRRPPFWELLSRAGVETAVVRFPFTFPADGQADFVISNRVGADEWRLLGVRTESTSELVFPAAQKPDLLALFFEESPRDRELVRDLLPEPPREKPASSVLDPVEVLRLAAGIDRRTLEASRQLILAHPDLPVTAVYLGGFDSVCHAFWQYRFPEDFSADPPRAADVAALGSVVDRYLEFLDRGLARLIEAYPSPPTVLVVSDHGHEAIHSHLLWKGWHSARGGLFIAAGRGIPHRSQDLEVSYLDIAPTVFELEGFEKPDTLAGRSLGLAQE